MNDNQLMQRATAILDKYESQSDAELRRNMTEEELDILLDCVELWTKKMSEQIELLKRGPSK